MRAGLAGLVRIGAFHQGTLEVDAKGARSWCR